MTKRETFFNMIQASKYLDEFDLMSKETEDKTFETGQFRWTLKKQFFGDELEVYIQYTNLHYLFKNKLNYKLTKSDFHKEVILWKCYVFDAEYAKARNMRCLNTKAKKIKNRLVFTDINVSKHQTSFV